MAESRRARSERACDRWRPTEVINRQSWRSREEVELATLDWVDWYDNRHLLEPLGYDPPAEAEAAYYAKATEFAIAA